MTTGTSGAERQPAWPVLLRALRTARGLTQEGWAVQLGVSDVTVRRWERGAAVPTAQAEAALLAWCRHHGLFRLFDNGVLRGITLTPDLLVDILAAARLDARSRRTAGAPFPAALVPPATAPHQPIGPSGDDAPAPELLLPVAPTRLIGRSEELARLQALVCDGITRLVTLTGPGGSGKTRLALEAARRLQPGFAGGVWIVRLEAVRDPDLVLPSIAAALRVVDTGVQPLLDQVRKKLSSAPALLVLDNFEQVRAAAPVVSDLIATCPDLVVLVTSRTPLRVDGEHELAVAPLNPSPAMQLFAERAAAVQPSLRLNDADLPVVADICARLDGLPLAIELAAVWMKVLPPRDLRDRLTPALSRRAPHPGDRPARHQTMLNTIAWSFDLLDTQEQTLFRRLAVFAGGWTLAAAETICADHLIATEDVLPLLAQLVDQSLVVTDLHGAEPRYRFLETIGGFAAEQLTRSGEQEPLRARHRAWYLAFAERESGNGAAGMDALTREHDNLRAVLDWRSGDGTDAEIRLRLTAALWRFWQLRGHLVEGRRCLEDALAAGPDAALQLRARVLNGLGSIAFYQGDMRGAKVHYGAALDARRALGDQRGAVVALTNRAMAAYSIDDVAEAFSWWEEALALARELADKRGIAQALGGLSLKAQDEGDHDHARALLEEGHAIWRELGDTIWLGRSAGNIAAVAYFQGDDQAALRFGEEANAISRQVDNKRNTAMSLHFLAKTHQRRGDDETARPLHHESLAVFRALGDWAGIARSLEAIAALAGAIQLPDRAARLFGAAAAIREQHTVPMAKYLRPEYTAAVTAARACLADEAAWAAAWDQGRAWTLDEALAAALEV